MYAEAKYRFSGLFLVSLFKNRYQRHCAVQRGVQLALYLAA
jgi:hypothetical protein